MVIKKQLLRIVPAFLERAVRIRYDVKELGQTPRLNVDAKNLKSIQEIALQELFSSRDSEMGWGETEKRTERFGIPDSTGGVNPGDRRAIYHIIRKFKPTAVLEIGTHIGASTVHIASALFMNQNPRNGKQADFVTVDIGDVNDPIAKPWLKYDSKYSPLDMMNEMGFGASVKFVTATSLDYFASCKQPYDIIFLDGSHAATAVYQEIPVALQLLNQDGLILLHDYFPNLKPLWSNGSLVPGPFLATERLKNEGANLVVLPLGKLPWPTKMHSNITSLALLLRNE